MFGERDTGHIDVAGGMMTAGELGTERRAMGSAMDRAARFGLILAGSLAVTFTFTSPIALQDIASFVGKVQHQNRWQAFSVPSAVGSANASTIAFAGTPEAKRLIAQTSRGAIGKSLFTNGTVKAPLRGTLATADEGRIMRADKGARVVTVVPQSSLPPRGFSAGSIMERQSMLGSRVIGGQERIRTAFSKVTQTSKDAMTVAMNFQLKGTPRSLRDRPEAPNDKIMMAALSPSSGAIGDTNALGYAAGGNENGRTSSLFEKILKDTPQAFIPPITGDDHAWAATPLAPTVFSNAEQTCLANGLYFEARGETVMGQAAVGQVILNRVRNPAYPNSICGVVYQNKSWRNRCQFSFACDGHRDRINDSGAWARAKRVAEQVTKGEIWIAEVGSATHYHAGYVHPRWASAMEKVDKIGRHIFYRTFNGGW